jgi:HK97 family phage portal protein
MFDRLIKAINDTPQDANQENNVLAQIVFPYLNNNLVVWFDAQDAQFFVDNGYRSNATVYSIIRKIGDKKAIAPLKVYEQSVDAATTATYKSFKYAGSAEKHALANSMKTKALKDAPESELATLLQYPNAYQCQSEFFKAIAGFYDLCGEAFIYGVGPGSDSKDYGKYTSLHVMPSHLVTIVQGDWMNPVAGYKLKIGNQTLMIPANDVLHIKTWNPNWTIQGNQLRGQSPLLAGLKNLKSSDVGTTAKTKSQQNEGAKGIVSPNHADPKLWLNETQVKQTETAVDKKMNGQDNLNKVVVSGMPLQYTQIGLSPQALAIIDSLKYDDEKLCLLWGIDPILLGLGRGTFSNQEAARKALVIDVVVPYLDEIEQKLNQWLTPAFNRASGKTYVLDFNTTVYSELAPDAKIIKEVYGDSYQIEPNEYRAMLNLDASVKPGMDENWVPSGLTQMKDLVATQDTQLKDLFNDYQ